MQNQTKQETENKPTAPKKLSLDKTSQVSGSNFLDELLVKTASKRAELDSEKKTKPQVQPKPSKELVKQVLEANTSKKEETKKPKKVKFNDEVMTHYYDKDYEKSNSDDLSLSSWDADDESSDNEGKIFIPKPSLKGIKPLSSK